MTNRIASVNEMTNPELAEIYNELADRPIKKFSDSSAAQRRTAKLVEESGMVIMTDGDNFWTAAKVDPEADTSNIRKRTIYQDFHLITLVAETNPKRDGSLAHARFALYSTKKTVGEFLDAAHELEPNKPRWKFIQDLHWDVRHGYITVAIEV